MSSGGKLSNRVLAKNSYSKYIPEIVISVAFITLASVLNMQFIEGSNIDTIIAGHDEYIAVKEVYSILHPLSVKHFFLAVIAGDVIYYGRLMFYIDALFAYIPFKIWGVGGMVYTVRMVHSLFLGASLLLLAFTFLKDAFQRVLFLVGSMALYYSLYFVMMPKPEPMQLFFLALFLYYFRKSDWSFGKHFIWLGIAFGLKFNVLLLLPVLFALPFYSRTEGNLVFTKEKIIKGLKSIGLFLEGLVIAIPCLALSPIKPIYIKNYIHETFGGTEKTYDDLSLTISDWIEKGLGGSYLGHWLLGYLFMTFALVVFLYGIYNMIRKKNSVYLLILTIGLILTWAIMIKTKRLWPHYIWTGYIFMLLGLLLFASSRASTASKRYLNAGITVFMLTSIFFFVNRELPLYTSLDKRSEAQEVYTESKQAIQYIRQHYPNAWVSTDGSVLFPFDDFVKAKPYHPFSSKLPKSKETIFWWNGDHHERMWDPPADVVVFYRWYPPDMRTMKKSYGGAQLADLYQKHIETDFVSDTSFGRVRIFKRKGL